MGSVLDATWILNVGPTVSEYIQHRHEYIQFYGYRLLGLEPIDYRRSMTIDKTGGTSCGTVSG